MDLPRDDAPLAPALDATTPASSTTFAPSPEQRAVIRHRGGHLQVIACAGSGKTEAIACRIADLLAEGVTPESIVAFTFTERAAASLKARVLKRASQRLGAGVLDRIGRMYLGTIHAYCFRLLQQHVPAYADFDLLDEHRVAGLLNREFHRLGLAALADRRWDAIAAFRRNADVVENERLDPAALTGTDFGEAYARWLATLERHHFLTYGQLITRAVEALEEPAVHARVHAPLRHLIVDEYQDINPVQERLIALLARDPVHLCVVGDDDQAIYQWRGSDVASLQAFTACHPGAATRTLSTNRRARPAILAAANAFATTIAPRLAKTMKPTRPAGGPEVHAWAAETPDDEAARIADTIEALVARGHRYRDVAVLLRSVRTSAPPILAALRARGIPVSCAGRTGLFQQPEAQLLARTVAWLTDSDWRPEKFAPPEPVTRDALIEQYRALFALDKAATAKVRKHLDAWHADAHDEKAPANLVLTFYELLRALGVGAWDADAPALAARLGTLARFSQLLADYEHVARRARREDDGAWRGGRSRGPWYYRGLFGYLQYYALGAYEDFDGEDGPALDAVTVLTVHQAKGLEWPVVFVPCLVDRRFPSQFAGRAQDWLLGDAVFPPATRARYEGSDADERRLFYVAMTRARDALYVSRFQRKKNRCAPSPYLVAVAGRDPSPGGALPLPPPFAPEADAEADRPALSFSELAAYLACPASYRLRDRLGFQPQLVAELGYGRAVHHTLRRIADLARASGRLPTAAEAEAVIADAFYLPFAHRAAYEKLLAAATTLVGRYLGAYGDDLERVWETERPFELHLPNAIVTGRADVILDREGGVDGALALVDYKTATDARAHDVYTFQLAIYAAAGRAEGLDVRAGYLHDLAAGKRLPVVVGRAMAAKMKARATRLADGIARGDFAPSPEPTKCAGCDVRFVCRHDTGR